MTRANADDLPAMQDIHRAEVLMSLARGLSRNQSAALLKYEAALGGVSLHAAALAVLWPDPNPVDRPIEAETSPSSPQQRRRHLFAVPPESGSSTTASTREIQSAR